MIPNGATIMCGGFLACGQARAIVKELVALGTKDLTLIANDMGRATGPMGEEFFGIAELIHNHQVKRVIATEGETVDIDFDTWTVTVTDADGNAKILEESYRKLATDARVTSNLEYPVKVGEGQRFVMGDNRNHSLDSRSSLIGLVDENEVIGKVLFRFFPLNKIGTVH